MSTPVTSGADPKKTADARRKQQMVGVIVILILTWLLLPSSPKVQSIQIRGELQQGELRPPPQLSSGVIEIVKGITNWNGVICLDDRMRIDGKILTPDVWWEVRLDKDNGRIHPLHPKNYAPGKHLEISNDFTVMEWRIRSDQTLDRAQVAWSISPKR